MSMASPIARHAARGKWSSVDRPAPLQLLLRRADEVPHQHQARRVLEDPLGIARDEAGAVREEELRELLAGLALDEGVQDRRVHRPDAVDELDREALLAPA